jgi:Z1 domain
MSHDEVRPVGQPAEQAYPVLGDTIEGFGAYLLKSEKLQRPEQFHRVRNESRDIVARCRRFDGPDGQATGLVVGYVQSGKTRSMTAVCALAHDNGCRIVIILAGVTTILLQQNAKRFRDELRASSGDRSAWKIFNSADGLTDATAHQLRQAVAEWRDRSLPESEQRTLLFVVLKNHTHLTQLENVLSAAGDLRGIPALVIDDEADQAGLNTTPNGPDASRTYRQIAALRSVLPHHTYLQYTATPQAPLLIALDDMLSPAFAELVEPGDGYTGGKAFFGPDAVPGLVAPVPTNDLFRPGAPPTAPPESLIDALRVFFVGCAVARLRGGPRPRSMLVHPSQRTADHGTYVAWITETTRRWAQTLRTGDPEDKEDTLDEFRGAYKELARTDANLPLFDDLVLGIQRSVAWVSIKEVNSEDGSEVDWDNSEEHILVGGEKLNRGFTVEGLTVTYMPRDAGGWNADTLQQRARFFGYKQRYLTLCRLYLHPDVIAAFRSYVRHEEDVRRQLAHHRGRPLREWRRAFFLSAQMRPTRQNVLSDPYFRVPRDRVWFTQRYPHIDEDAVRRNRTAVDQMEARSTWRKEDGFYEHRVAEVPLREVYADLLVSYEVRGGDLAGWYGALFTIADILETTPDAQAFVLQMTGERGRERLRTPDGGVATGAVALHQGRTGGRDGYPGDARMALGGAVTVQIHRLRVGDRGDIPALAIHIPTELRRDDVGTLGSG